MKTRIFNEKVNILTLLYINRREVISYKLQLFTIILYTEIKGNFNLPRDPKTSFDYKTSIAQRGMFCRHKWSREPVVK